MEGFGTLGCVPEVWQPPPTSRSFHPLIHGKTAWTSLALLQGSSKRQVVPFLASVPVPFLPPGFGPPWISLWHPGVHPIHLCHPCPAVSSAAGPPHRSASHRYHARASRSCGKISMGKGDRIESSFESHSSLLHSTTRRRWPRQLRTSSAQPCRTRVRSEGRRGMRRRVPRPWSS